MPNSTTNNTDEVISQNEVVEEVEMIYSHIMGIDIARNDAFYLSNYNDYVTNEYSENNMFYCEDCEELHTEDDFDSWSDLCHSCRERRDEEYEDEELPEQDANVSLNNPDYQSEDKGKFIISKRKFGVEIECDAISPSNLSTIKCNIEDDYGTIHDGSVRGNYPVEVVSPVLQGKKGEESLIKTLDTLNSNGIQVNNSCGLHVHLDSSDFYKKEEEIVIKHIEKLSDKEFKEFITDNRYYDAIMSEKTLTRLGNNTKVAQIIDDFKKKDTSVLLFEGRWYFKRSRIVKNEKEEPYCRVYRQIELLEDSNVKIMTSELKKHIERQIKSGHTDADFSCLNTNKLVLDQEMLSIEDIKKFYAIYIDKDTSSVRIIKNLMGFYLVFSDVITSMLPNSRRNNHYCSPITDKFTIKQIYNSEGLDDLMKLWYETTNITYIKASRVKSKYDDSRYYGINFHSLFRNGTVEIRYHSGTTNKIKILFWIFLHQQIIDLIVEGKITKEDIESARNLIGLQSKLKAFFALLKLPKKVEEYVKTRIAHLNNVSKRSLSAKKPMENDSEDNDY